ncbi:MAG TPA: S41 family peptidase [Thermoanaerobaculia bacterium]
MPSHKRALPAPVCLLVVCLLFAACATRPPAPAPAPPAAGPAPPSAAAVRTWTAAELRAELAELYSGLQAAHYDLFAFRTKADYDRQYAATREAIRDGMTAREVVRLFQPFVAFGRVGHARLDFPVADYIAAARDGGKILPLDIRVEDGRVFVAYDYTGDPRLAPGTELLSLDGRPMAEEVAAIGRYVSGETDYFVHAQLEEYFPRWLWLDRGSIDRFTLEVARPEGRTTVTVAGQPIGEVEPLKSQWSTRLHEREVRILDGGIAYLRPGPFYNVDGGDSMDVTAFHAFVDQAFAQVLAAGAGKLIVDVRNNPGGDNSFSDHLVAWFAARPFRFSDAFHLKASPQTLAAYAPKPGEPYDAAGLVGRMYGEMSRRGAGETFLFDLSYVEPRAASRFGGRVYVLVNRHSYSNSASMAAMVQDYGFATILGEETGDLPTTYASSVRFTLPRTGLSVSYPKSYFVRPNGDRSLRGVVPDLAIPTPRPGASTAPDPVLDAAIALVRGH